jgi:hypothetical protein
MLLAPLVLFYVAADLPPAGDVGALLMGRLTLDIASETLRLAQPFRISGHVFDTSDIIVVTLSEGGRRGARRSVRGLLPGRDGRRHAGPDRGRPRGDRGRADAGGPALRPAARRGPQRRRLRPVGAGGGADGPAGLAAGGAGRPPAAAHHLHPRGRHARGHGAGRDRLCGGAVDQDQADRRPGPGPGAGAGDPAARPDAWLGVDGNQGFVRADLDGWSRPWSSSGCRCWSSPWRVATSTSSRASTVPSRSRPTKAASRWPTWRRRWAVSRSSTSSSTSAAG